MIAKFRTPVVTFINFFLVFPKKKKLLTINT